MGPSPFILCPKLMCFFFPASHHTAKHTAAHTHTHDSQPLYTDRHTHLLEQQLSIDHHDSTRGSPHDPAPTQVRHHSDQQPPHRRRCFLGSLTTGHTAVISHRACPRNGRPLVGGLPSARRPTHTTASDSRPPIGKFFVEKSNSRTQLISIE